MFRPLIEAPDDDHRSDADDDADQRQKSAQFVGKDRLQSNLQGVGIKGKKAFIVCTGLPARKAGNWLYENAKAKVLWISDVRPEPCLACSAKRRNSNSGVRIPSQQVLSAFPQYPVP